MQLVIIAGGKGTRLGLKDIPKPMVLLGDKPIIHHQIDLAIRHGIKDIVIIGGYLSEVIVDYFKEDMPNGIDLTIIQELKPMGTAGALHSAKSILQDRFMVFYGDLYLDFDINKFIEFYEHIRASATIIVQPNAYPDEADLLEVDNMVVKNIYPKPRGKDKEYKNISNAAVYIFDRAILHFIDSTEPQDFGKDVFPRMLNNGVSIIAYETDEILKDLGTLEKLEGVRNDYFKNSI